MEAGLAGCAGQAWLDARTPGENLLKRVKTQIIRHTNTLSPRSTGRRFQSLRAFYQVRSRGTFDVLDGMTCVVAVFPTSQTIN